MCDRPMILGFLILVGSACGAKAQPSPTSARNDSTNAASASSASPTAAPAANDDEKFAAAETAPHEDPNEAEGPIEMPALVTKGTPKSAFPKSTVSDRECLKDMPFTGKHKKDYEALVTKCGTPTGMLKYVEPREGRLHAKLDKRDHYRIKVYKGYCYRYFAVADDGIKDIDIVIQRKGALLGMDRTTSPIAVIETDNLWCMDEDVELDFGVEVDGPGAGGYTFGVWTRVK